MSNRLTPEEYERRRQFMAIMETMSQNEYIGIARILRKNNVALSENPTGFLVDFMNVSNEIMDELMEFHRFVERNNIDLEIRDAEIVALKATTWKEYKEPNEQSAVGDFASGH